MIFANFSVFSMLTEFIEDWIRYFIIFLTKYLPVKVIRDYKGRPFLYRYHLFSFGNDGPGLCIHNFVNSDPDRGYHDHPWANSLSFILCGKYEERILQCSDNSDNKDKNKFETKTRNRWTFNYLDGKKTFHRVMLEPGKDVWTIFCFKKRSKIWNMVGLDGKRTPMSKTIKDTDGGWWHTVGKGLGLYSHLEYPGKIIATVDIIIIAENSNNNGKILLIKRGKNPCKECWSFPGGRIEQKDDDIVSAAYRELKEETNLVDVKLEYLKTVGNSKRDPRGFCITNIFIGILNKLPEGIRAGDDAVDYEWFDLDNLPDMAFDHKDIITVLIKHKNHNISKKIEN